MSGLETPWLKDEEELFELNRDLEKLRLLLGKVQKDEKYGPLQFIARASREENKLFFPVFTAKYSKILAASSRRLEGLTRWLIGLTIVLSVLTGISVFS